MKSRSFIDSVTIHVAAGDGGDGVASFCREKYRPKGGPDGGDGGHGGDVVLRADADTDSLVHLFFRPHQKSEPGGHGRGKKLRGKNGAHLVVPVPCGTQISLDDSGEVLADLVDAGAEVIVARGGRGGLGNCHWATATHQAPTEQTDGEAGGRFDLRLELKVVADAGLVGFPNAGKSSLLSHISRAHPKIGAYPFTTLHPIIGTLTTDDYRYYRIADIPGIIEDAHAGAGLGLTFLRHIERSRVLIFVLDMAASEGRDPADDYRNLLRELSAHRADLADRPALVVANKMDMPEAEENLRKFIGDTKTDPIPVSTVTAIGIDRLTAELIDLLGQA